MAVDDRLLFVRPSFIQLRLMYILAHSHSHTHTHTECSVQYALPLFELLSFQYSFLFVLSKSTMMAGHSSLSPAYCSSYSLHTHMLLQIKTFHFAMGHRHFAFTATAALTLIP